MRKTFFFNNNYTLIEKIIGKNDSDFKNNVFLYNRN